MIFIKAVILLNFIAKVEIKKYNIAGNWYRSIITEKRNQGALVSSDHDANETHIDVRWAHNSKTEYQNSSVSIFLSNDQNMTLRMDLAASSSNASFLWGPNGAWGYEDHPLDPNEDDFIGGAVESTVSDSLWHAQVKIPWDFLPPNVMRIQVNNFH